MGTTSYDMGTGYCSSIYKYTRICPIHEYTRTCSIYEYTRTGSNWCSLVSDNDVSSFDICSRTSILLPWMYL